MEIASEVEFSALPQAAAAFVSGAGFWLRMSYHVYNVSPVVATGPADLIVARPVFVPGVPVMVSVPDRQAAALMKSMDPVAGVKDIDGNAVVAVAVKLNGLPGAVLLTPVKRSTDRQIVIPAANVTVIVSPGPRAVVTLQTKTSMSANPTLVLCELRLAQVLP